MSESRKPVVMFASEARGASSEDYFLHLTQAWNGAKYFWSEGGVVISTALNTAFMDSPKIISEISEGYLLLLEICDHLVVGPGWKASQLVLKLEAKARALGLPVIYPPEEG